MTTHASSLLGPHVRVRAAELGLRRLSPAVYDLIGVLPGRPRLAIVGSRAAHRRVLRTIAPIVAAAGARGWSLISGGALGIDGAGHRAALEHGLTQLAVLPCGMDRLYPPNHSRLFRTLVESGRAGLLFARPAGTDTSRAMFASRNAIVVGLADALLVAEAGLRSGSRGTGELGLRAGIPTAAIGGTPGCGVLIGAGARAFPCPPSADDPRALAELAESVGAWLDELGGLAPAAVIEVRWPAQLAWLAELLATAGPAGLSIDGMSSAAGVAVDPGRAAVALCEAELLGLVCEATPGRWVALGRPRSPQDD